MKVVTLTITIEVPSPELLINYTSGFMTADESIGARVAAVVGGIDPHPRLPEINGINIVETLHAESR